VNFARSFVRAEALCDEPRQRGGILVLTGAQHDEGGDPLAEVLVWDAYHRHFTDRRVLE
jgi:hypothetical protein